MTVLKTLSSKNCRISLATCAPRFVRSPYIVNTTPYHVQAGVQAAADPGQRGHQVCQPLERKVFAMQRDQDCIGGNQRIQGQQPERWWRIDEDEVVAVPQPGEEMAQAVLALLQGDQLHLRSGEVTIGRNEVEQVHRRLKHWQLAVSKQGLIHRVLRPCFLAEPTGEVPLRVHVDDEDALVGHRKRRGEVDRGGGLADPTLLVGHRDDLAHDLMRAWRDGRATWSRCDAVAQQRQPTNPGRTGRIPSRGPESALPWREVC